MTPKEKAIELFNKYEELSHNFPVDLDYYTDDYIYISRDFVKHAAIIAVYEIIASNPHSNPINSEPESTMKWWFKVKEEIKKL